MSHYDELLEDWRDRGFEGPIDPDVDPPLAYCDRCGARCAEGEDLCDGCDRPGGRRRRRPRRPR